MVWRYGQHLSPKFNLTVFRKQVLQTTDGRPRCDSFSAVHSHKAEP